MSESSVQATEEVFKALKELPDLVRNRDPSQIVVAILEASSSYYNVIGCSPLSVDMELAAKGIPGAGFRHRKERHLCVRKDDKLTINNKLVGIPFSLYISQGLYLFLRPFQFRHQV
ncbi:hypothetical protein E4U57_004699 [Claviceps arundinis]|uniref:Uncharacterized protein n=1 Tax=Claviceps arundinis TaxID=1623583 RepID=A0A9P7MR44_9HYPO|nr:hypothetical protein E4U57_004699 [Claviceps arundinis]KAG5967130.1 hypothetical protein E4U56_000994 [Claviceps arundinis]